MCGKKPLYVASYTTIYFDCYINALSEKLFFGVD